MSFRLFPLILVVLVAAIAQADSVRTLDGKIIDGVVKLDPKGGLSIARRSGPSPVHVDFAQLLRVKLDATDQPPEVAAPDPWTGTDIGITGVGGSNKLTGTTLTVEAAGSGITGQKDSFRLVSQTLTGNGEIAIHLVPGAQQRPKMKFGIMIRSSIEANAPYVAMLMATDGTTVVSTRGRADEAARVVATTKEQLPLWVRLVRKDATVVAYKSPDNRTWTRIGDANVDLGDNSLAGVALTSTDPNALCAAPFEKGRVLSDEPTGATVTDLSDLRQITNRPANKPVAHVSSKTAPSAATVNGAVLQRGMINGQSFEARYPINGKYNNLVGDVFLADRDKGGGAVTFQIFGDADKLFDSGKVSGNSPPIPFNLSMSNRKELRLVVNVVGEGDFSSAEFRRLRLVTQSPVRQVAKTRSSTILTVNGSSYAGAEVQSVTADTVRFTRGDRRDLSVPANQVSRIYMPGLTQPAMDKLTTTSSGVLMTNGDFYEGDIDRVDDGKVQVNSVLFGPREFQLKRDVLALVLRAAATDVKPSEFVVMAADGSVFLADTLATDGNQLTVTDRSLGKIAVDLRSVREIRYGGDRLKWLADLRPRRVDTPADQSAVNGFLIDSTVFGSGMQLVGADCDRGVSLAAGTSVTYDLDGQYKTLLCVAGVPVEMLPDVSAVFIAEADGKEIFRSPARSSVQDALPVSIDTTNLKTITLRVETEKGVNLPVFGLWGDPLLVKTGP